MIRKFIKKFSVHENNKKDKIEITIFLPIKKDRCNCNCLFSFEFILVINQIVDLIYP